MQQMGHQGRGELGAYRADDQAKRAAVAIAMAKVAAGAPLWRACVRTAEKTGWSASSIRAWLAAAAAVLLVCSTAAAIPGDADGNGTVDGSDYAVWAAHFERHTSKGAAEGDFNGDRVVDGLDYLVWSGFVGQSDPDVDPQPGDPALWVDPLGNDSNPGTADRPLRTLQRAADLVRPGDVVRVRKGYYAGFVLRTSGTSQAGITFEADPAADEVVCDGDYGGTFGVQSRGVGFTSIVGIDFRDFPKDGVQLEDAVAFSLVDSRVYRNGRAGGWDHGVAAYRCDLLTLHDVVIYENRACGIYAELVEGADLQRVVANNNGSADNQDGITFQNSSRIMLSACEAHNNGEDGIDFGGLEQFGHSMNAVVCVDCLAANNVGEGFAVSATDGTEFQTFDVVLRNCRSLNNKSDGVQIYQRAERVTLEGCEMTGNRRGWNIHTGARDVLFDGCRWDKPGYPATSDPAINFVIQ